MTLRPYQQAASDAAIAWMRQSIEPACIEAVTAAGKSHVIADMALRIHEMTGKRVLCLAPSAELVVQNRSKMLATGTPASMFSASAGAKDLRHPIVFGSPLTVKNRISRFQDGYAMVVLDECHGISPTVRGIIEEMRAGNPNLRVIGLTATPYRLGSGYIFRQWPDGVVNDDTRARDPYFTKCVYRITGPDLIKQGYLTKPVIGETGAEHYDTRALALNSRGQFDAAAVDRAYHGHGRKTAAIVADVVARSRDRMGVMLFAATVRHAEEVMASLPPDLSAMITGDTPKGERASIIARFKARRIKYLVNVAVLTTGFDAPHVDVIAILRKTESVGLLQQIIGRGLRLHDGKQNCLARGTLVLTNRGEVKIEDVTLDDKVWDGVSFVSHSGSFCKGVQSVIEHDGITATPDHEVMTDEGWQKISDAKRLGRRIVRTGVGGTAVRFLGDNFKSHGGEIQRAEGSSKMRQVRKPVYEQSEQYEKAAKHARLPILQPENASECSEVALSALPSPKGQVHKREEQSLSSLRRAGDKVQFRKPQCCRPLDCRKHRGANERNGTGPDGQRRPLRARELEMGSPGHEHFQQQEIERRQGEVRFIPGKIPGSEVCRQNAHEAYFDHERSGNYTEMEHPFEQAKREVWDIHNAGPLQRFTANGRLVHNCLVLDYTDNIETHCPDGDLFAPEVKAGKGGGDNEGLKCLCPDCGYENRFPAKPDTLEYAKDENGYCLDLTGHRVETEWGPLPGHFGRRCWGMVQVPGGRVDRCGYRWTSKECEACGAANDIAARYCAECKAELVDPGEKLRFEFRAMKRDPMQPQCDEVVDVRFIRGVSQRGADTVRAEWTTPYRKLTTWHMPHAPHAKGRRDWERFAAATADGTIPPRSISYVKEPSGFYRALAFNAEPDHAPE